jgi:hypothetical protein
MGRIGAAGETAGVSAEATARQRNGKTKQRAALMITRGVGMGAAKSSTSRKNIEKKLLI